MACGMDHEESRIEINRLYSWMHCCLEKEKETSTFWTTSMNMFVTIFFSKRCLSWMQIMKHIRVLQCNNLYDNMNACILATISLYHSIQYCIVVNILTEAPDNTNQSCWNRSQSNIEVVEIDCLHIAWPPPQPWSYQWPPHGQLWISSSLTGTTTESMEASIHNISSLPHAGNITC